MPDKDIASVDVPPPAVLADQLAATLLGPEGSITTSIRDQVKGQIEPKLASITDELEELREKNAELRSAVATKPPADTDADTQSLDMAVSLFKPLGEARKNPAWNPRLDPRIYNPAAPGAADSNYAGSFKGFSDFVRGVNTMGLPGAGDPRLQFRAALTGEEVELGGALVPEEFRAQLQMLMLEVLSIRSRAMVVPMGSATLSLPYVREETHSDGAVYGGMVGYWPESGDPITESEPLFGQVTLTAKQLAILTTVNNTLLMDSAVTLQAIIGMLFATTTRWTEERAFIKGSGAGQPTGVLNAPATISVSTSDSPTLAQFGGMLGRLLPESSGRAAWMMHPYHRGHLLTLETAQGGAAFMPSLASGLPDTFLGMPCIFSEHLAAPAANAKSVLLADWMFYLIGDRQTMSMATSEHSKFANNQTQFRSVSRVDGQPWLDTPLTMDGGGTVSPFVVNS